MDRLHSVFLDTLTALGLQLAEKEASMSTLEPHRHSADKHAPCVLVYGLDRLLLETRAKVIHTVGLRTCEANSARGLFERLEYARCKVLVLCHTLPEDEAVRASLLARQKIPGIKIIALAPYSPAFDETLAGFVGPNELLAALSRTLLN